MSQKIKEIIQQYGKLALVTHISLSVMFYAGAYLIISSGVVDINKVYSFFKIKPPENQITQKGTNAFLAYIVYKGTMPLRILVTSVTVPLLARILRRK